jgi:hypothetical protein
MQVRLFVTRGVTRVLHRRAGVRVLAQRDLPGGGHERANSQISEVGGVMLMA